MSAPVNANLLIGGLHVARRGGENGFPGITAKLSNNRIRTALSCSTASPRINLRSGMDFSCPMLNA
jgi:hypothetical protein